jgi:similar to stage IV sporulation protein
VGVEVIGTQVRIQVVEQTIPEQRQLMNPRHLVANVDAVISEIYVEHGRPKVRLNTKVKKGDLLISGVIGDEENERAIVAKGVVKGIVWHEYAISSPLVHKHKVYTGDSKQRRYLVIGNRALQLTGYGKLPFKNYETDSDRKSIKWRQWTLPIGWINEELLAVEINENKVSTKDARTIALTHARSDVLIKAGDEARIVEENILHEKIEGGKVYMKVLFEVEQEITEELPIIQGE